MHDLEVLVNEAAMYVPDVARYSKACRKISGYYIAERYPLLDSLPPTVEEVSRSRDEITGLVEFIRRECGT